MKNRTMISISKNQETKKDHKPAAIHVENKNNPLLMNQYRRKKKDYRLISEKLPKEITNPDRNKKLKNTNKNSQLKKDSKLKIFPSLSTRKKVMLKLNLLPSQSKNPNRSNKLNNKYTNNHSKRKLLLKKLSIKKKKLLISQKQ